MSPVIIPTSYCFHLVNVLVNICTTTHTVGTCCDIKHLKPCQKRHVACSSCSCLGAYETKPSQKGCDHKELLPPSSHHCPDPSLSAHSCPTALRPLPLLIVLQSHESGGETS